MNNPYKYFKGRKSRLESSLSQSMHLKYTPKHVKKQTKLSIKRLQTYTPRYLQTTESAMRKSSVSTPDLKQYKYDDNDLRVVTKNKKRRKNKNKTKKSKKLANYLNNYVPNDLNNFQKRVLRSFSRSKERKVTFTEPDYDALFDENINERLEKTQRLPFQNKDAFNIVKSYNGDIEHIHPIKSSSKSTFGKSKSPKSKISKFSAVSNSGSKPSNGAFNGLNSKSSTSYSKTSMQKYLRELIQEGSVSPTYAVSSTEGRGKC
jgi:hypothetical protein